MNTYTSIAVNEVSRLCGMLKETDPRSPEYRTLMQNIEVMANTLDMYDGLDKFIASITPAGEPKAEEVPVLEGQTSMFGAEEPEEQPAETPEPYVDTPSPFPAEDTTAPENPPDTSEPEVKYDMADVRAAMVVARHKGLNITSILSEFGVENFSAFPAGRYAELMVKLGAA